MKSIETILIRIYIVQLLKKREKDSKKLLQIVPLLRD